MGVIVNHIKEIPSSSRCIPRDVDGIADIEGMCRGVDIGSGHG